MKRWAIALAILSVSASASARRARFEPTDLELEDTGVLDTDLQLGAFRGNPNRAPAIDGELDLGLRDDVELDLDFAFYAVDHKVTADPLWLSIKLGLIDGVDPETKRGWAFGAQLGPRLAVVEHARGSGFESLLLLGRVWPSLQLVLNGGFVYDAPTRETPHRSVGFELGLDAVHPLKKGFSVIWDVSALRQTSEDPSQLYATLGLLRDFGESFALSAVAYYGFVSQGDRVGLLVGISPKTKLF